MDATLETVPMTDLNRSQRIYDAVHGFIRFNPLERKLIDSAPFQRLHHIHQLGIAFIVYPGATHTRFEHSLGAMEVATQIFERIASKDFTLEDAPYWLQIIRCAALCHDLGHLPFSHDGEKALLSKAGHEEWTKAVIESQELRPIWEELATHFSKGDVVNDVLKMAIGEKKLREMGVEFSFSPLENVLSQVVTGDFFGADRIDYLLRDAQCTGVSYGLFDYHQLIEMLCVLPFEGNLQLGIEENGVESCEALLLARHFMHQRVYQYSSVKANKFHICRFMKIFFDQGDYLTSLSNYLLLSDCEILAALRKVSLETQAPGHLDARALINKEKRFKAVSIKDGITEGDLNALLLKIGIPQEAVHLELISSKNPYKGLNFPVKMRSGAIVSGKECSKISVPETHVQWVYLAPEFEKEFRGALEQWS